MEKRVKVWLIKVIALVIFGACVCGCTLVREGAKMFRTPEPIDPSAVAQFWDGPKIGPGMNLNIKVGSPTTGFQQMAVMVDQNGEVMLPHLLDHTVPCDGMTLEDFKKKLLEEYSKYYKQPQVEVSFGAYDGHGVSPWGTVMVMGQVGTQGPVNMPPTNDLTVTKVLQLAGGAKPFGDTTRIKVFRCDKDGHQTAYKVDIREIGEDGRFDKDLTLRAGDVVYVPEQWF